jgi:hypothetical protein
MRDQVQYKQTSSVNREFLALFKMMAEDARSIAKIKSPFGSTKKILRMTKPVPSIQPSHPPWRILSPRLVLPPKIKMFVVRLALI